MYLLFRKNRLYITKVPYLKPKQVFHVLNEEMYQIIKSIYFPLNNEFMFQKSYYDTLTIHKINLCVPLKCYNSTVN